MTEPGWTRAVTYALAVHLAGLGVGTWSLTDPVPDGAVGIFHAWKPPGPDRCVVLTPYQVSDDPDTTDVVLGMQIRARGAVGDVGEPDDLADLIHHHLHGARRLLLGPAEVVLAWRQSTTTFGPGSGGADTADRWERVDNYRLRTARSTPNLTD